VLAGLDEFMLRLGHLTVLCSVAAETRSSWSRIAKDTGSLVTRMVPIPADALDALVPYLEAKRLCPSAVGTDTAEERDYRYPDLLIAGDSAATRHLLTRGEDPVPRVWWQDICLAAPEVRSRVGAVGASRAKATSKTGLSHICDWSMLLDLVSSAGEPTPEGRLLTMAGATVASGDLTPNPYILRGERIVFAYKLLSADLDVFGRLAPKLIQQTEGIKKADGMRLFAETIQGLADEADEARYLTSRQQYRIAQHLRELEHAVRKGAPKGAELGTSSTAWHRTSSRLESYVDLGLLEKGRKGEHEKYEYIYYPTDALQRAVDTMGRSASALDWLEEHLSWCLTPSARPCTPLDEGELRQLLPRITAALARPTAPLPITALALGLAWIKADVGESLSIRAGRESVEELARRQPRLARLSRGASGERAEFVSFDMRELGL
jgi:hypothetical protein